MLGFFGKDEKRYGAVVDVGSGSVGVALVFSESKKPMPQIIWSYRERMLVRKSDSADMAKKLMATTILKAYLELGNNGVRALRQFDKSARISRVFATVAAPWSYTLVKTISLKKDNDFEVTKKLIDELTSKASAAGRDEANKSAVAKKFSLTPIDNATIGVFANDYATRDPFGNTVNNLTVTQLTGMAESGIVKALESASNKIFPSAKLEINTFMSTYYSAMCELKPDTSETCLVDITAEATELGLIRNNVLERATHVPFGSYTLARKISEAISIPNEEALGFMRENAIDTKKALSESKKQMLDDIIGKYVTVISELFKQTGDALSIPKTIFIHTDESMESFFSLCVKEAAQKTTGLEHKIHLVTSKYFGPESKHDTAMLLSAYVFHKDIADPEYLD